MAALIRQREHPGWSPPPSDRCWSIGPVIARTRISIGHERLKVAADNRRTEPKNDRQLCRRCRTTVEQRASHSLGTGAG